METNFEKFKEKIGDERFIRPLTFYRCFIDYVTVLPNKEIQQILPNFVSSAVIKALEAVKDCPKSALSMEVSNSESNSGFKSDSAIEFIKITNT